MRGLAILTGALAVAACSSEPPKPEAVATEVPQELQASNTARIAESAEGATPMTDRVATIGLLNKRNNISQDLVMKPGESRRVGDIIVRVSACERTAPWEMPQETGAFVQVLVEGKGDDAGNWRKIFSSWMFRNSPGLAVVEHPTYDVWVKDCAMRYPGETPPGTSPPATPAPAPQPAPSPAPSPTPSASPATAE